MEDKNKKASPLLFSAIAAVAVIAVLALAFTLGGENAGSSPENCVRAFYSSVLPNLNENKLKKCVGEKVYGERFDDEGYFADRLSRSKDGIVFYYGKDFKSKLTDFSVSALDESEDNSVKNEYKSKYYLEVSETAVVRFCITLSGDGKESSRYEKIRVVRIKNSWYVFDYDAYWFAFM